MFINPIQDAINKFVFSRNCISEYDLIETAFLSVEGCIEVRYPNDVIKSYYLPVNSKIKEFIKNEERFQKNIQEDFVHPNVYIHETLFSLKEKVGRLELPTEYCESLKHAATRPLETRPMAFQKKVADKKANPLFSIDEETEDVHYTKDVFTGMSRKYLKASFRVKTPETIYKEGLESGNKDFMEYLPKSLPFKLYGLYTQEKFLNSNLKYVMGFSWSNGKNQRRIMNQEEEEVSSFTPTKKDSPISYKKVDYDKGMIFAWKYYRQLKFIYAPRVKFYGQDGERLVTKIPNQREYPLNIGLSILNFPQMSADGSVIEPNDSNIYAALEKVNQVSVEAYEKKSRYKEYFSEYSLFDYSTRANFSVSFDIEPILDKLTAYRWAEFYKQVLKLRKNEFTAQ